MCVQTALTRQEMGIIRWVDQGLRGVEVEELNGTDGGLMS